jgi:hypothetical protein
LAPRELVWCITNASISGPRDVKRAAADGTNHLAIVLREGREVQLEAPPDVLRSVSCDERQDRGMRGVG